jgi:hypothetical protein
MESPYDGRPAEAFWRTGVVDPAPDLPGLYRPRFAIGPGDAVATAGSCFAQEIGRPLRAHGFNVLDAEPAPAELPPERHAAHAYGLYSARTGAIYTVQQLLWLARQAFGEVARDAIAWERDGHWFDAFRPGVEPDGMTSRDAVAAERAYHLSRVRALFLDIDVFLFTLGLTEHWGLKGTDAVFPMAPGTIAGTWDMERYEFRNAGVLDVVRDYARFDALLVRHRAGRPLRHVLTVSPVPLTATASGRHVLIASTEAKAVLRAAAGELVRTMDNVDYFPAYEIVTNPATRADAFADNLRTVSRSAVDAVVRAFLAAHCAAPLPLRPGAAVESGDDAPCEEALLEAFGGR